ncbi:hypothetical protein J3F83DRAFT_377269 [Trichoderma novae-zelandiae]
MGLLDFISKRPSADATSSLKSQASFSNARGVLASRESGTRTPDPSQRLIKPRLVGVSDGQPRTNSRGSESAKPQSQLKPIGRSTDELRAGPSYLSNIPRYDDRERPHSRGAMDRLTPLTPNFSLPRRRSSAFIDVLDAQGELKPYDFRSRVQASGSRDYGEDVADRNIQPAVAGSTLPHRLRGSASTASSFKHVYDVPAIPDRYRTGSSPKVEPTDRPTSRQASSGGRPRSRGRLSPATESVDRANGFGGHDLHDYRPQSKSPYGQISITGSRASTPQQAPRTARYLRDEDDSLPLELRPASPPGVPRYRSRQYGLPSSGLLAGPTPGSVRSARETISKSLLPPHSDRSKHLYQQRCKTPTSPNQLHSFRHKAENDWSRFNRYSGEHLQPTAPHWDDAASSASEYAPSFTFGSTGNLQLENTERQPSVRTFGKRGSMSSFAPSDYSSHQFPGGRSIGTADTSIDIPHTPLFNQMSFGGGSCRNLRSRGGDSSLAPDSNVKEDDSCGESIFISPATPVDEEQPIRNPLSPGHRGLSVSSYDAATTSDSDVDSFRDKHRRAGRDGEALLFRGEGFGDDGKCLPGLFNNPDNLGPPQWPDMPMTPTDVSEMGDDEASVVGMPLALRRLRPSPSKSFTQRERLLALGYDYDSDSDTESSARTDELPEERALELISSLMKGTTCPEAKNAQHPDEKTIAKLRKDIKRRRMLDARKGSKFPGKERSDIEAMTTQTEMTES